MENVLLACLCVCVQPDCKAELAAWRGRMLMRREPAALSGGSVLAATSPPLPLAASLSASWV